MQNSHNSLTAYFLKGGREKTLGARSNLHCDVKLSTLGIMGVYFISRQLDYVTAFSIKHEEK